MNESKNENLQKIQPSSDLDNVKLNTVSIGNRFVHYFFDLVFMYIMMFVLGYIIGIFRLHSLGMLIQNHPFIFGLLCFYIYFVVCEFLWGRTIGKLFTKSVVVNENGLKPTFGKIILRSLIRFVPFEPFSVLSSTTKMWHDTWTKTIVVKAASINSGVGEFIPEPRP